MGFAADTAWCRGNVLALRCQLYLSCLLCRSCRGSLPCGHAVLLAPPRPCLLPSTRRVYVARWSVAGCSLVDRRLGVRWGWLRHGGLARFPLSVCVPLAPPFAHAPVVCSLCLVVNIIHIFATNAIPWRRC